MPDEKVNEEKEKEESWGSLLYGAAKRGVIYTGVVVWNTGKFLAPLGVLGLTGYYSALKGVEKGMEQLLPAENHEEA